MRADGGRLALAFAAVAVVVCAASGCGGSVIEIAGSDGSAGDGSSGSGAVGGGSGSSGAACQGGACLPPSSSSSGSGSSSSSSSSGGGCVCPGGCCDSNNDCYAGVIDQLCGESGGTCRDCTRFGQVCEGGTCASPSPPSPPASCVGNDASSCAVICPVLFQPCCKGYGGACGCVFEDGTGGCD